MKYETGEGFEGGLVNQSSEEWENETYLHKNMESISNEDGNSENESNKDESSKDNWLDKGSNCKIFDTEVVAVTVFSNWAKKKLDQIVKDKVFITQQWWWLGKIPTTLEVFLSLLPLVHLHTSIWHVVHETSCKGINLVNY